MGMPIGVSNTTVCVSSLEHREPQVVLLLQRVDRRLTCIDEVSCFTDQDMVVNGYFFNVQAPTSGTGKFLGTVGRAVETGDRGGFWA